MSGPLVFMMGKFEAEFPTDRRYAKNHMWGQRLEDVIRFGFTAYAVRLLQDVYFLDWAVDEGTVLSERQEIGSIESKKAESSLYAPVAGRLVRFNEELLSDPSAINLHKYGAGWLFEIEAAGEALLDPPGYIDHLTAVWEVTQRTIKGQMNEQAFMAKRIAVVVSQGQSANPAKRQLEEEIVGGLLMEPGVDVVVIPHLYDLTADGTGVLALRGIMGNMIVLAWLYDRAARWTLDRFGIRGKEGFTTIKAADDEDEDEENSNDEAAAEAKERVIDTREVPNRRIYCIDLRVHSSPQPYIDEVKRIARENSMQLMGLDTWIGGSPKPEQLQRFIQPTNDVALGPPVEIKSIPNEPSSPALPSALRIPHSDESARRWYPVIDYGRCTNCMECIDFCLFGVYGVDKVETILVEQPDNCRKGCPACSRVCPENAIIFPQHKTPTIAGAPVVAGSLKIDLSKLFGAPDTGETAEQAAVRERDEQLVLAGRQAVGTAVGVPKRQATKSSEPKDDLDNLIDALDNF